MSNLIAWIIRAIPFGTIIMFGSMGEITTEKSGNLNLGVPGIMYLGGFAGFASSYFYEKNAADPKGWICVLLALTAAIAASMLGGLIFSFLTITLRDKPERYRSCSYNLWYGCCQLFRCIYFKWCKLYSGTSCLCIFFKEDSVPVNEAWNYQ